MRRPLTLFLTLTLVLTLSLLTYAQVTSGDPVSYTNQPAQDSYFGMGAPPLVALFQDQNPWGGTRNQEILTAKNISFQIVPSAQMESIDLSQFPKIVIASQQPDQFWMRLSDNRARFEDYARNGGVLEMHLANLQGSAVERVTLPFGIRVSPFSCVNRVSITRPEDVLLNRPFTITEAELQNWNCSSHGVLMGIENVVGATIIISNAEGPEGPTTVAGYGAEADGGFVGDVVVTYQPVEWTGTMNNRRFHQNLLCFRLEGQGNCPPEPGP